jgi:predicted RNase H-like HicB family nuclease
MFCEYIQAAMSKAVYEIIDDEEPYYGEVPELKGVWATGKTAEECRENLQMAIEDWIAFSLRCNLPIPAIEGHRIEAPVAA